MLIVHAGYQPCLVQVLDAALSGGTHVIVQQEYIITQDTQAALTEIARSSTLADPYENPVEENGDGPQRPRQLVTHAGHALPAGHRLKERDYG